MHELLYPINRKQLHETIDISQYVYQYGYINKIVWIYPDHWRNYSKTFIHGLNYHRFRDVISNMTYYIRPIGNNQYNFTFSSDGLSNDEIEFFETKLSFSKNITSQSYDIFDSSKSIKLDINAIALSELQQLMENDDEILNESEIILDFDLDFFICQSPSETLKDYFDWNDDELIDLFNTYLSHHQYSPTHIHVNDLHHAMMVLLHQLSNNQSDPQKSHGTGLRTNDDFKHELDLKLNYDKNKMQQDLPKISDAIQHAIQEGLDPLELRDLLYHLYRYHLELNDPELMHPINDYLHAHHHLDTYLFVHHNKSHVINHHLEHHKIAQKLKRQVNTEFVANVSVNLFAEIVRDETRKHPNHDIMEKWIDSHQILFDEVEDSDLNDEDFIKQLLTKVCLNTLFSMVNIFQLP